MTALATQDRNIGAVIGLHRVAAASLGDNARKAFELTNTVTIDRKIYDVAADPDPTRGPKDDTCPAAEIDLRVGGRYRIANRFADGRVVWIAGEFESIERPHRLIFSGVYELPVGRGRQIGGGMSRLLDTVIGGWQTNGVYNLQSGSALGILTLKSAPASSSRRPDTVMRPS